MRGRRGWARAGCIAALGALFAGCFGLSQPAPPVQQYRLDYSTEAPAGKPLPLVLRVPPMEVAATYDREPIVYREGDYSVDTYFYYRWASNPGNMVADLLAHDFANSGLYRDVQTSVSMVPPDYQLKGTVEEIEERIESRGCSVHLELRLTLSAARGPRDSRVRYSKLYRADEPCRCEDPASVPPSMSRALARISAEVQSDVYQQLAADRAAAPG